MHGGPEKPLHDAMRLTLPRRSQDFGDTKVLGYLSRRAAKRSGPSPRERSTLQSTQLREGGDLKRDLTSDMEMQRLEFDPRCESCFGPVQCLIPMLPPLLLILVASNSISSSVLGLYDMDTAIFPLSPPPQPLCLCFCMLLLFLQARPAGSVTSSFLF